MEQTVVLEPPLYFSPDNVHIWNTSFHPNQNILACSLINGSVEILKYDSEDVVRLLKVDSVHKGSVRWVTFNGQGTLLASCSEDKRIGFVDSEGKIAHIIKKAHNEAINRCQFVDEHIFMSGDDDGEIKLWDLRTTQCIFEAKQQSDTISGLRFDPQHTNIISSSLDGTLAIYDVKKGSESQDKLYAISDSIDEELNGLEIIKGGKYIVCPSSQSSVVIYKRSSIENYCDRIQGIPGSVECILKIDENTLLTGSEDGFVRGVAVKPNKIMQTIGQHEEDEHFPVQSLAISHCRNIIASTSHDNSIKFYDVSQFIKKRTLEPVKKEQEGHLDLLDSQSEMVEGEGKVKKYQINEGEDSDDFEDEDDSDSEQMEEEEMGEKGKKRKKYAKSTCIKMREKQLKKEKQKSFFKGL